MHRHYKSGQAVPTSPRCPLCQGSDNIAHLLGECAHPIMKGLIDERHNTAGRMILRQLKNGARGASDFVADLGSQHKLTIWDCTQTRVPYDLLPDRALPEVPGQVGSAESGLGESVKACS